MILDQYLNEKSKEIVKSTKKEYIKPEYELVKKMTFMFDSIKGGKYSCRQCSSCHGCR